MSLELRLLQKKKYMSSYTLPTPLASSKTIVVTATINHAWKAKKTDFSIAKKLKQMQNDVEGSKMLNHFTFTT